MRSYNILEILQHVVRVLNSSRLYYPNCISLQDLCNDVKIQRKTILQGTLLKNHPVMKKENKGNQSV